jgi:hypothetical protein
MGSASALVDTGNSLVFGLLDRTQFGAAVRDYRTQ